MARTRERGVSVSEVARQYDVNANLVFKWLRDPRFEVVGEDETAFLPVEVVADPPVIERDAVMAESRIEIALSNGCRLSLRGAFDPEAVCRLVRGLAS